MQYVYTEELEINPLHHLGFKNMSEYFKTVLMLLKKGSLYCDSSKTFRYFAQ